MRTSKPESEYLWRIGIKKKKSRPKSRLLWTQRGMIPRPSDYESAALTN